MSSLKSRKLTGGGADVAIEALGLQVTFENALRCLRPGGTLSSLGVYSGKLQVPYDAFAAGLGDYKIVTTLCPGGKERMRRLMSMVQSKRFDPTPLLTHSFRLDQIVEAYDVFGSRRDGVLKGGHQAVIPLQNWKRRNAGYPLQRTIGFVHQVGPRQCRAHGGIIKSAPCILRNYGQ